MLCEIAPPSDQDVKISCVPADGVSRRVTAIVWGPGGSVSTAGAVCGAPLSTVNCKPVGLVKIVTGACGVKVAVKVAAVLVTFIVRPAVDTPSAHDRNVYTAPPGRVCVAPSATVCDPCESSSVCGAVRSVPPSTLNCRPAGLV